MTSENNIKNLKCFVIGKYGIGSRSLISTLIEKEFPSETALRKFMNMEGYHHILHLVNNQQVDIAFWYETGGEDFDILRPLSFPGTDVFLLTFAINDRTSLAKIQDLYHPQIRNFCDKSESVPIILCGTKVDTRDGCTEECKSGGFVTCEEGKQIAASLETVGYVECSAKEMINMQLILDLACRTGLEFNQSLKKKTKCHII
eukprot:Seg1101.3 transcript_id=Seg1101.3/GoldUCD/mRNA.D3Y31 product="Ras-like GTP-binding protein RhoL" protein_id=Seg1101.3/GoldUCD/D3Y31